MADKVRVLRGCGRLSLLSLSLRELSPFRRRKPVSFARNLHRSTRLRQNQGSTHSGEDAEKGIETDVGVEHQAAMAEEPEAQRPAGMEEFESKQAQEWGKDQQCDRAEELKTTECIGEKEEKCQEELRVEEEKRELSMDVQVVVDHERRDAEQEPCVVEDVQEAGGARGTKEEKCQEELRVEEEKRELSMDVLVVVDHERRDAEQEPCVVEDVQEAGGAWGTKEEKCQEELRVEEEKRELSMDVLVVVDHERRDAEQEPCVVEDVQEAGGARGTKEEKCQEKREVSMDVLVVVDHERRDAEQEPCIVEEVQEAGGARGTKEEKEYFPEGGGELPPHESVVSNGDVEGVPGLFVVDTEPGLGKNLYIEPESTETEKEQKEKRKKKLRRKGGGAADAGKAREKIAAEMVSPSEGVRKDTHRVEHVECEKKSEERPRLKDKRKAQRKEKNSLRQKPPTSIDVGELPADFDTPCIDIMGSGRSAAVMRVQLRQSEIKEQRQRRQKKLKDKSKTWFELPMTEVSPEIRQNLLALRLRDYANPKRFYKTPDRAGFPKHFQMGTVLNSPVEFYSSRISRKMRQRNFLEEMMADAEQRSFRKRKMASIMAEGQAKSAGKKTWLRLGGYKVLKRGVGKGGNGRNSTLASKKQKEKEKRKQRKLYL